jgi:hypothetical protein
MKKLIALLFGASMATTAAFGCGKDLDTSGRSGQGEVQGHENCTHLGCYWLLTPGHDAWDDLDNGVNPPNGPNTVFYRSGLTYQQVLLRPSNNEAYYFCAYHFIAAQLNEINGANTHEIDATFETTALLFEQYGPGDVANDAALDDAFRNAGLELMAFNTGELGPGTCTCNVVSERPAPGDQVATAPSSAALDAGVPPPPPIDAPTPPPPPPIDGGSAPGIDASVPPIDAALPVIDASVPEIDAGEPPLPDACVCMDGPDHT